MKYVELSVASIHIYRVQNSLQFKHNSFYSIDKMVQILLDSTPAMQIRSLHWIGMLQT